jgi:hypothetical protein
MKLRLSRLAPYGALMAVSLIQTFAFQASAQSSSEDPPHLMQQDSQPPSLASSLTQGERRLTGCIRSDHGKYLVESKLQKKVWLSGPEDFGPHAGHTVILYGTFLNGSGPPKAGRSDQRKPGQQSPSRPESNFQVTKIEMLSDTCALNKAKASDQP